MRTAWYLTLSHPDAWSLENYSLFKKLVNLWLDCGGLTTITEINFLELIYTMLAISCKNEIINSYIVN